MNAWGPLKGRTFSIGMMLLTFSAFCTAEIRQLTYSGHAYDTRNDNLVFVERYAEYYNRANQLVRSSVKYYSNADSLLAEKQLDYHAHPYAPAFRYSNIKTGYTESLRWIGDKEILLTHYEPGKTEKQKRLTLNDDPNEPYVADAGFDSYIRANLTTLSRGEALTFRFLNPSRLDWFRFQATLLDKREAYLLVEVVPKNRLLRLLVAPIFLSYATDNPVHGQQRLMQYSGLTNMSLDNQEYIKANILYRYENTPQQLVNMF